MSNMSILFKNTTKQKNKNEYYYLPEDTFDKLQSVNPNPLDLNKNSLVTDLY